MSTLSRRIKGLERGCGGFVPPGPETDPQQWTEAQLIWWMTDDEKAEMSDAEFCDWLREHGLEEWAASLEALCAKP